MCVVVVMFILWIVYVLYALIDGRGKVDSSEYPYSDW